MPDAALADLPARVETVVIGAGQAGLSAAYHLHRLGLEPFDDFAVLDRGPGTGGAWQHRWPALRLDATHRVADLPGMQDLGISFARAPQTEQARETVAEYYRAYEDAFDLRVVRPVAVDAVEYAPDGFVVTARDTATSAVRRLSTAAVVNATGTWGAPNIPDVPGRDVFLGRQVHTNGYWSAEEFRGQRVAIVGGGTSALGFLAELDGVAAETFWFTRRPVVFVDTADGLGVEGGIAAVAKQDAAARAGEVLPSIVSSTGVPVVGYFRDLYERGALQPIPMFTAITPEGVVTADGDVLQVDAIIWATGFRAELDHLDPLDVREPGGGIRVVDGRLVREPRIWLAGYGPQASTISANRAGRVTARAVAQELGFR